MCAGARQPHIVFFFFAVLTNLLVSLSNAARRALLQISMPNFLCPNVSRFVTPSALLCRLCQRCQLPDRR